MDNVHVVKPGEIFEVEGIHFSYRVKEGVPFIDLMTTDEDEDVVLRRLIGKGIYLEKIPDIYKQCKFCDFPIELMAAVLHYLLKTLPLCCKCFRKHELHGVC